MKRTLIPAAAAVLFLSACGGGGGGTDGDASTTQRSVVGVVGGQPMALSFGGLPATVSGAVTLDGKSITAKAVGSSDDVQPGDVVDAIATINAAGTSVSLSAVNVRFEVQGTLTRVDTATGTVELLGQVIVTDALTRIYEDNPDDSYSSVTLADLVVGQYVEVSGTRRADDTILATRIERKLIRSGDVGYSDAQLRGAVSQLDAVTKIFFIDNQRVDYAAATVRGTLADGSRVEVEGSLSGSTLVANKVEIEDDFDDDRRGGESELEGPVTALDAVARRFDLFGYTVDYSTARLRGTLVEGARVEVEGRLDATTPGLVIAREIEVKHRDGGSALSDSEIKGAVTAVNPLGLTLSVAGLDFYTDASTVFERDDRGVSLGSLLTGDFVEVKFDSRQVVGGRAYATKIELESGRDGSEGNVSGGDDSGYELKGRIAGFDAVARSFTLNGYTVQVGAGTYYESGDRSITADAFFAGARDGQRCEVKGSLVGTVLTARKIELDDGSGERNDD
jgi:hypothetical protein